MNIHLAKSAGFCSGVKRAVRIALETAAQEALPVYMLGEIVHNEHVVNELDAAGIRMVDSIDQIDSGILLIRAHGAVPEIYEAARKKGIRIVDATCPLVLEIHEVARTLQEEGYRVSIIGDHGHDEVVGIAGQVDRAIVIASPKEAETALEHCTRIGVVVQSTQDIENVQQILAVMAGKCREIKFINTICAPTKKHQEEIRRLPYEHDIVIVIGSFSSANTCRLTAIARTANPRVYQVESASDVQAEWFTGARSVGISAGASTPDKVIDDVVARIQALNNYSSIF